MNEERGHMSKITVQFYGICTHVTMPDGRYRVILPKAGEQQIAREHVLTRQGVQPHVARLQILKSDLLSDPHNGFPPDEEDEKTWKWRLDGVTLSVNDAADPQPLVVPHVSFFPSLKAYSCGPVELRAACSNAFATPDLFACFFDLPRVAPVAKRTASGADGSATVGVVQVETIGSVSDAVNISLTKSPDIAVTFTVKADAQITLFSYPEVASSRQPSDKDADFLLHFLSTTEMPERSWFPPAPPWEECREEIQTTNPPFHARTFFTGPGCSNSTYP